MSSRTEAGYIPPDSSSLTMREDENQIVTKKRAEGSLWVKSMQRLRRNRAAMVCVAYIVFIALVAVFAPLFAPANPVVQTGNNSMRPPAWIRAGESTGGTWEHVLGTDTLGRDQFSRLIFGSRVSLIVGFIPQIIILVVGVGIGIVSGFAGGWIDNLLMRFTDIVYAFPELLFLITITVAFRDSFIGQAFNGLLLIFIALAIVGWTGLTRLVRGQVLSLRKKEFIEAAEALGVPWWKVMWRHILPNTLAPIIVSISFGIPSAIIAEAILTFLGVGMRPSVDPSNPFPTSWGVMMQEGFNNVSGGPWGLLFPVLCISSLMLAFTFVGDGLRDALDPRDQS